MQVDIKTTGSTRLSDQFRQLRCPICTIGSLLKVRDEVWQCERRQCNSEFFYDTDELDRRMLNCRDKPGWIPLPKRRDPVVICVLIVLRALLGFAGALVMYAEGLQQRTPGVGFVIGAVLILLAIVPWRKS